MLLLSYYTGETLGCINLSKAESIIVKIIHMDSINFVIDNTPFNISPHSIFSSIGADGKDVSTDIEEIVRFEKENDLTNGMYETSLPQLIMLYIAKQPKIDFFSFVKKEYIEYKNAKVEEAINSLPD